MADITTILASVNASAKKKPVGRPCKIQNVQRDENQLVLGFQFWPTGDGTLQSGDGGETEVGAEPTSSSTSTTN